MRRDLTHKDGTTVNYARRSRSYFTRGKVARNVDRQTVLSLTIIEDWSPRSRRERSLVQLSKSRRGEILTRRSQPRVIIDFRFIFDGIRVVLAVRSDPRRVFLRTPPLVDPPPSPYSTYSHWEVVRHLVQTRQNLCHGRVELARLVNDVNQNRS